MKTITKFIIGLVITAHQVYGLLDVQGCDVGTTYENSTLREFVMNQFTKNVPKQDELLRTKLYFNAKSPAISIAEKDKQLVFGYNHKTPGEFGIFMTHEDWMDATNPCHAKLKKDVFSEDFYTELDVVLKKGFKFLFFSFFFIYFKYFL